MMHEPVTVCTVDDYNQILADFAQFWDNDRTRRLHNPTLIHEFGSTAFVIKDNQTVAAYLFGFYAQTGPVGYVHLLGVRRAYRRQGLASRLYAHFIQVAKANGCTQVKAITSPTNSRSIGFHTAIGMVLQGTPNANGIPVVKDYAGIGEDRVVFLMEI
jgi:GNAT superfamily N-acetyltransferase